MAVLPGYPAVSGAATFQDIRRSLAGQVVTSAAGVLRKGILPSVTTNLVAGTATMNVAVADFVAVLDRNGAVFVPNVGTTNVLLSTAPASGSRWSIVYVKQRESEAPFSDGATGPILDKVESVTSEAAARALLPAGALELAVVQVNAGSATTSAGGVTITQTYRYTAMEGGVVLLRNQAEQDAWTPHDGSLAYRIDGGRLIQYLATATTPGWYHIGGEPILDVITFVGIYGSSGARIASQAGRVFMEGFVTSSSAGFVAGTAYSLGSIPAALAPAEDQTFACSANATAVGAVTVSTTGTLTLRINVGFTGPLSLALAGCNWRHKSI